MTKMNTFTHTSLITLGWRKYFSKLFQIFIHRATVLGTLILTRVSDLNLFSHHVHEPWVLQKARQTTSTEHTLNRQQLHTHQDNNSHVDSWGKNRCLNSIYTSEFLTVVCTVKPSYNSYATNLHSRLSH